MLGHDLGPLQAARPSGLLPESIGYLGRIAGRRQPHLHDRLDVKISPLPSTLLRDGAAGGVKICELGDSSEPVVVDIGVSGAVRDGHAELGTYAVVVVENTVDGSAATRARIVVS